MILEGIVLDPGQDPLNNVHVFYVDDFGNQLFDPPGAVTGPAPGVFPGGYFQIGFVPGGNLAFSHIGFETKIFELGDEPDFLEIEMIYEDYDLPEVIITPGEPDTGNGSMPWLLIGALALFALND